MPNGVQLTSTRTRWAAASGDRLRTVASIASIGPTGHRLMVLMSGLLKVGDAPEAKASPASKVLGSGSLTISSGTRMQQLRRKGGGPHNELSGCLRIGSLLLTETPRAW